MRCKLCGKNIHDGEAVCGYRHGEMDNILDLFVPDRDSAWIVMCTKCSERFHIMVYSKLNPDNIYVRQG